jgi:hypothetical protein
MIPPVALQVSTVLGSLWQFLAILGGARRSTALSLDPYHLAHGFACRSRFVRPPNV